MKFPPFPKVEISRRYSQHNASIPVLGWGRTAGLGIARHSGQNLSFGAVTEEDDMGLRGFREMVWVVARSRVLERFLAVAQCFTRPFFSFGFFFTIPGPIFCIAFANLVRCPSPGRTRATPTVQRRRRGVMDALAPSLALEIRCHGARLRAGSPGLQDHQNKDEVFSFAFILRFPCKDGPIFVLQSLYCIREFGPLPIPRPNTRHANGAATSSRW